MEVVTCKHDETTDMSNPAMWFGECKHCGQVRQFDPTKADIDSEVITKIGRIGDAIVMPLKGQKLLITPEESRLVRKGWDKQFVPDGRKSRYSPSLKEPEEHHPLDLGAEAEPEPEASPVAVSRHVSPEAVDERAAIRGRPTTGEWLHCVDCDKDIFVRRYRLDQNPGAEHRCLKCSRRHSASLPRTSRVEPKEVKMEKPVSVRPGPYKVGRYLDKHRDEILADRLSIGVRKTQKKWKINSSSFRVVVARWRKAGYDIPDLRGKEGHRGGVHEHRTQPEAGETQTPTVRAEHEQSAKGTKEEKKVLGSEDKIEITVGRLEELLRDAEYWRGYHQAVLDIFGKSGKN